MILQTALSFTAFSEKYSIPSKLLAANDVSRLWQFFQGQRTRFARGTVEKKIIRVLRDELRANIDEKLRPEKEQMVHDLIVEFADVLSLSDHQPIRCEVRLRSCGEGDIEIYISSWNVQEFVRDGLSLYIATMPSIRRPDKAKGSVGKPSKLLMEAMLSDIVRERHTRRVVDFIQRQLDDPRVAVVCLQEVSLKVLEAIRCAPGGLFSVQLSAT